MLNRLRKRGKEEISNQKKNVGGRLISAPQYNILNIQKSSLALKKSQLSQYYNFWDGFNADQRRRYLEELKNLLARFKKLRLLAGQMLSEAHFQQVNRVIDKLKRSKQMVKDFDLFEHYKSENYNLHFGKFSKYTDFNRNELDAHLTKAYRSAAPHNADRAALTENYSFVPPINKAGFREYSVTYEVNRFPFTACFIETQRYEKPLIIINNFPKESQNNVQALSGDDLFKARMKYSLTVASQLIASFDENPSESNQIEFSIYEQPDQIFLYAAIRLLGKQEKLNFNEKAIQIPGDKSGTLRAKLEREYQLFIRQHQHQALIDEVKNDFEVVIKQALDQESDFFREAEEIKQEMLKLGKGENQSQNQLQDENQLQDKLESIRDYQNYVQLLDVLINSATNARTTFSRAYLPNLNPFLRSNRM